jgi:hypothetical protein
VANAVRVGLDGLVFDASLREALEERIEPCDGQRDPTRARLCRVGLDEECGVFVDIPEDLVSDAHVWGPAEETSVPVDAGVEIRHRDAGDELSDGAHLGWRLERPTGVQREPDGVRSTTSTE